MTKISHVRTYSVQSTRNSAKGKNIKTNPGGVKSLPVTFHICSLHCQDPKRQTIFNVVVIVSEYLWS